MSTDVIANDFLVDWKTSSNFSMSRRAVSLPRFLGLHSPGAVSDFVAWAMKKHVSLCRQPVGCPACQRAAEVMAQAAREVTAWRTFFRAMRRYRRRAETIRDPIERAMTVGRLGWIRHEPTAGAPRHYAKSAKVLGHRTSAWLYERAAEAVARLRAVVPANVDHRSAETADLSVAA